MPELQQLFILGAAGIGKSTLCQRIAYLWASQNKNGMPFRNDFDYVFWLPLRNLTKYIDANEDLTLPQMIYRVCFLQNGLTEKLVFESDQGNYTHISETEFVSAWAQHFNNKALKERTLFLLDGYDELPSLEHETTFKNIKLRLVDTGDWECGVIVQEFTNHDMSCANRRMIIRIGIYEMNILQIKLIPNRISCVDTRTVSVSSIYDSEKDSLVGIFGLDDVCILGNLIGTGTHRNEIFIRPFVVNKTFSCR